MSVFEIILISIGLAMDAFGVSIGKGLTMKWSKSDLSLFIRAISVPYARYRMAYWSSVYRCYL